MNRLFHTILPILCALSMVQCHQAEHGEKITPSNLTIGKPFARYAKARFVFDPPYANRPESAEDLIAMARLESALNNEVTRGENNPDPQRFLTLLDYFKDPAKIDQATADLVALADEYPDDPDIWSDLAAIYFDDFEINHRYGRLPQAFSAAEKALHLDENHPQATFNQALILADLGMPHEAKKTWEHYLAIDPNSEFSVEARAYHVALHKPNGAEKWETRKQEVLATAQRGEPVDDLIEPFLFAACRLVEEELLPAWGRGEDTLEAAETISRAIKTHNGDSYFLDIIQAIDEAPEKEVQYREALKAYGGFEAGQGCEILVPYLDKAPGPLKYRFDFQVNTCWDLDNSASYEATLRLTRTVDQNYTFLEGEIWWERAVMADVVGQPVDSKKAYLEVIRRNEQSKYVDLHHGIRIQLAALLAWLGEHDEAWRHVHLAAEHLNQFTKSNRLTRFYQVSAYIAECSENYSLAMQYLSPLAEYEIGSWSRAIESTQKARYTHRLGRGEEAKRHLTDVERHANKVEDPSSHAEIWSTASLTAAELAATPREAISFLEDGLDFARKHETQVFMVEILTSLAKHYRLSGNSARAGDYLGQAFDLIEKHRAELESSSRMRFFDAMGIFYALAIEMAIEDDEDEEKAFALLEQSRMRVLSDQVAGETVRPFETGDLLKQFNPDTTLVFYNVTGRHWYVHLIYQNNIQPVIELPISPDILVEKVEHLNKKITAGARQADVSLELDELYQALIAPIEAYFGEGPLVLVTSGVLNRLPFAALAREDGDCLGTRVPLIHSPSANVYARCRQRSRSMEIGRETLVLGADEFNRSSFPRLSSLPLVSEEVKTIAGIYPGSSLKEQATIDIFLENLAKAGIVHFAGHAIVNAFAPEFSSLLFRPSEKHPEGVLSLGDLASQVRLDQTRLVFLSACSTSAGFERGSEGIASLGKGFLAAGAPTVIATLWDIPDQAGMTFSTRFHRALSQGATPVAALRSAQAQAAKADLPLREWSGFVCIGYGQ